VEHWVCVARSALCLLLLLALKGHTLLIWFTRSVILIYRWLVWLENLQDGEVGELLGTADTIRHWELEAGILDNVRVTVSTMVALITPDAIC